MNTNTINFSQLFLRLALAASLLSAVADRLGLWGPPGAVNVSWGNWENFLAYSNKLNFYVSPQIGNVLAILATVLEVVFGVMFVIGYKTRLASWGTFLLMVIFALSMTVALGVKPPLSYSVWTTAGAAALLGSISRYKWSIDNLK